MIIGSIWSFKLGIHVYILEWLKKLIGLLNGDESFV